MSNKSEFIKTFTIGVISIAIVVIAQSLTFDRTQFHGTKIAQANATEGSAQFDAEANSICDGEKYDPTLSYPQINQETSKKGLIGLECSAFDNSTGFGVKGHCTKPNECNIEKYVQDGKELDAKLPDGTKLPEPWMPAEQSGNTAGVPGNPSPYNNSALIKDAFQDPKSAAGAGVKSVASQAEPKVGSLSPKELLDPKKVTEFNSKLQESVRVNTPKSAEPSPGRASSPGPVHPDYPKGLSNEQLKNPKLVREYNEWFDKQQYDTNDTRPRRAGTRVETPNELVQAESASNSSRSWRSSIGYAARTAAFWALRVGGWVLGIMFPASPAY